jgi:hypothetical protein
MAEHSNGMHTGRVAAALGGLALVIVACAGAVYFLAGAWDAPLAGASAPETVRIPEPQLEAAPQIDRSRYFTEKEALLERYEWIDRAHGVARIPIDAAMAIVAAEGASKRHAETKR